MRPSFWLSTSTFVLLCLRDMTAGLVSHSVLGALSGETLSEADCGAFDNGQLFLAFIVQCETLWQVVLDF